MKKIGRIATVTYLISFITSIITYLTRTLLSRKLSVVEYGLFYSLISFFILLKPFRELGLSEATIFYIKKYKVKKEWSKLKLIIILNLLPKIAVALLISLLLFLLRKEISMFIFKQPIVEKILVFFLAVYLLEGIYFSVCDILRAFNLFIENRIVIFLHKLSFLLFSLTLINYIDRLTAVVTSYNLAFIIAFSSGLLFLFVKAKDLFKHKIIFEKNIVKEVFTYSLPIFLTSSVGILLAKIDTFLITLLIGVEKAAYYEIAVPCLNIILLLAAPFFDMLFPILSREFHKHNIKRIKRIYEIILNNYLIVTLPIALLFITYTPLVIKILFGEKYLKAVTATRILGLAFIFMILRNTNFSILGSLKEIKERSKIIIFASLLNVFLDIFAILLIGIEGAAITTLFVSFVMSSLSLKVVKKHFDYTINKKEQAKIVLSSVLFIITVTLLKRVLSLPLILELIIVLSISSFIYLASLILLKVLTRKKIEYLKKLIF